MKSSLKIKLTKKEAQAKAIWNRFVKNPSRESIEKSLKIEDELDKIRTQLTPDSETISYMRKELKEKREKIRKLYIIIDHLKKEATV